MPLVCVGINHRTAPLALRERLALAPDAQRRWLHAAALHELGEREGLGEFAVLSTCNRIEVYAAAADPDRRLAAAPAGLIDLLAASAGLTQPALASHCYQHTGAAVVRHLCRVAARLDSMVPGEFEILGQVVRAAELATREGTIGPLLESAFGTAVRAGRRARAETGIGRLPTSVSTEAVRLLADVAGPLDRLAILIVGTGKM